MTVEEIDRVLASWRERLARVDENLIALEQDPTCQLLEGRDGRAVELEGVTRERVLPALEAMHELFEQRARLNDVLERARELREGSVLWLSEGTRGAIEALLFGPSIALPPIETPLARRGLLGTAETAVAMKPEELLTGMIRTFDAARDAVTEAGAAWARLDQAQTRLQSELSRLELLAHDVGRDADPELGSIRAQATEVRGRIARDPLGVASALEGTLIPRLEALRTTLEAARGQREQARSHLEEAKARQRELVREVPLATEALERARREIDPAPSQVPPTTAEVEALGPWLATLEARVGEGKYATAEVGLGRFLAVARSYLSQARAARDAGEAPLHQREELAGRLRARRAQMEALQAKGAVLDPSLEALAGQAEELGARRPTPVAQVAEKVADLEARLVALKRR